MVSKNPEIRNKGKLREMQSQIPGSNLLVTSRNIEVILKDGTSRNFDENEEQELFELISRESTHKDADLTFKVTEVVSFQGILCPEGIHIPKTRRCHVDVPRVRRV